MLEPQNVKYDLTKVPSKLSLKKNVINAIDPGAPKKLGDGGRDYQVRAYKAFLGKNRTILISPTGSGKSLIQVMCAAKEILDSNYKQRQVIIVPQLDIGNGFSHAKHQLLEIDGKVYRWDIKLDCTAEGAKDSVNKMVDFLVHEHTCKYEKANGIIGGCTAIVCYPSLCAAFKEIDRRIQKGELTRKDKMRIIRNTSFRFDEGHHICGIGLDGQSNGLGRVCTDILMCGGSLHLTTATFFRGNNLAILNNEYMSTFEFFRVDFMEHCRACGLEELHQNFCSYKSGDDLMDQIVSSISAEPNEKPIIIVPSNGQKHFKTNDKNDWTHKLIKRLEAVFGEGRVLNLVVSNVQDQNKRILTKDQSQFDAIVTCMMAQEGSDWPVCSRVYNTVLDGNVQKVIQKLGRALRPHKGKSVVKMINYIEHFADWTGRREVTRRKLSDRFNAVVGISMLDDMIFPDLMRRINPKTGKNEKKADFTLEDVYGDNRNEVVKELVKRCESLSRDDDHYNDKVNDVIDEVIEEFGGAIVVSFEELRNRLRREVVRRFNPNLKLGNMISKLIRDIGWDKVLQDHVKPNSVFNGKANIKELASLHKFMCKESRFTKIINELRKRPNQCQGIKRGDPLYQEVVWMKKVYDEFMQQEAAV